MVNRDRDTEGRARNARPRDAFGRPMPHGSQGEERVPEDIVLEPAESLAEAQRLLDSGHPFHAHEVLEGAWKAAPSHERDLWQGLAQVAVGLTHAQRGNAKGAVSLLHRGAERVQPYADDPPHGISAESVTSHATELAGRIESDGLDEITPADLDPRLTRQPQHRG